MAKALDFSLQLKANNEDLKRKVNEALHTLNQFNEQVRNGGGAFQTASSGAAKFGSSVGGLATQANQSAQSVRRISTEAADVPSRLTPIASGVQSIGRSLVGWAAGIASIAAVKQGIDAVLNATMEMDKIKTRFEYAFGGAEEAGKQLEFVRETANRLGLEFTGTAQGYSQLASATKDLNITNEETQQIFTGVASAAATMGLSADETSGVILALSQIAGKGKVSMEELRGQLGERLTPAMSIAAKAMGVTTAELEQMVANGLSAEEFLPKFGAALEEAFGGQAEKNAQRLSGQINLLKNQFDELLVELGNSGLADAAADVVGELSKALSWVEEQLKSLDGTLTGALSDNLKNTWNTLKTALDEIGGAFSLMYDTINTIGSALKTITGSAGDFDLLKNQLNGFNILIGLVSDGLKGIGVAFELIAGTILNSWSNALNLLSKVTFGDLSDNFAQAAAEMEAAAASHFSAAEKKALEFESSAVAAAKASMETEAERFSRLEQEARKAYEEAVKSAEGAAEKAKSAHQAAFMAIGTEQEKSTRKAAEEADKQAAAALKAAKSSETAWEKAYEKVGGSAEAVKNIKQPLIELQAETEKTAELFGNVGEAAEDASKKAAALAAETAKTKAVLDKFGVDAETAMGKPTKAMQEMLNEFPQLQTALQQTGITGAAAGNAVKQAFETMVKKAETQADIEAIRTKLQEMADSGVLSVQQVAAVTDDLDAKLKKVAGATDETTAAFERLGIKSKQALAESAAKMIADFETVKASGQATAEELDKAFKKAAQAAAASGDSQAKIWMQSEAWMRGYTVAVDKNGETVVKKSEEAKQATEKLKSSYDEAGESGVRASKSRSAALDEEIAKTQELANATASLKSDFASAKSGEITRTTGMSSYRTTYEYFKGKGFSDAEVAQLMTRTKEINDQAWNKLTTYQKSISTYGSGYGMTGANKALEEVYQRRASVSAYTPPAVSSPTTSTGAGRTVDLNLNLGGTTVNATTTTGQMASLENLLKQLEQSKRISGY